MLANIAPHNNFGLKETRIFVHMHDGFHDIDTQPYKVWGMYGEGEDLEGAFLRPVGINWHCQDSVILRAERPLKP